MKAFLLICLLYMVYQSNGISIRMDSKRNFYCCKVEVAANAVLEGSYLISGESEEQTTVRVYNPRYEVSFERPKRGAGTFTIPSGSNGGNYSICTENLSRTTKTLTLHFGVTQEAAQTGTGSQVDVLNRKVRTLYTTLNQISTNIEKLRTRETVHYEMIKASNKSVVLWNILKIVAFIVVACIEVYMITDFFNKQEKRREAFRAAQTKF